MGAEWRSTSDREDGVVTSTVDAVRRTTAPEWVHGPRVPGSHRTASPFTVTVTVTVTVTGTGTVDGAWARPELTSRRPVAEEATHRG